LPWKLNISMRKTLEFASEEVEAAYISRTIFFIYSYSLLKKLRLIVIGGCNSSRHERFMCEKFFKNEVSENNSKKFHDQWKTG